MPDPALEHKFELKLSDGRVVTWTGTDGENAARRAADCLGVTVVAWRHPRVAILIGTSRIDG